MISDAKLSDGAMAGFVPVYADFLVCIESLFVFTSIISFHRLLLHDFDILLVIALYQLLYRHLLWSLGFLLFVQLNLQLAVDIGLKSLNLF